MDVKLPDGTILRGVPDGMSQQEILGQLQLAKHPAAESLMKHMAAQQTAADLEGAGFVENMRAGAGKAFADVGRGAAQLVRMGPTGEEVRETKQRDQALMNTGAGITGNLAGNVAMFAPAAMIPGANTVAGAGVISSVAGALQPAEGILDRTKNTLMAGGLGAGTQALAGPVATKLGEWGARRQADAALQKSQNQVADETLRMGREAGYGLPPSAVNDSWVGRRLESVGGKAAVGQDFSLQNIGVTNKLGRQAASLSPEQPLSVTNLRNKRFELAAPYRDVAALSPQAKADLEALQLARHESKLAWKEYNRQGVRTAYNDAIAADARVKQLEQNIEAIAQQVGGRPGLAQAVRDARTKLAQNHQVQAALNRGDGSLDPAVIGRALDNGVPLSGPLEVIARMQQAYPQYMREASKVPPPGVSKSEALASALLATTGAAAGGLPGLAAGAIPFVAPPVARSVLSSGPVQNAVMTPTYNPGMLANAASNLQDPKVREQLANAMRALALSSVPAAVNQ